ncbi:prolyl 4-hydroxylase subunit alpha-1-like [Drosophila kikkawai]|uniref:procollagen-proline 4-dioxygenase n=1 Tax=Drosophila kikkawai TaxID=30033 RepID=A0A6P4IAT9_DROKI|nr:prolyl 4-hydroxylase subunit alpha-1-like [Drosophila kikkawai]
MQFFCFLLVLIYFFNPCQGQLVENYNFTLPKGFARSVINMDELLHLEDDLAFNLEQYVEALSQKANTIRMGIQEMTTRYEERIEPELNPAWNPFNSYSLIRHMQADWMMWQLYMEKPAGQENLDSLNSKMLELPEHSDLKDAAEGIRRAQKIYNMSASDVAKGLLDGVQYNASLTARDCLEMGRYLMNQTRWIKAKEWITAGMQALTRIDDHQPELQELTGTSKVELLTTLGQVLVKLNMSEAALQAYQAALKESPYDAKLLQEFRLAETELLTRPAIHDSSQDDIPDAHDLPNCCSGRCELPRKLRLYCLYNTTASSFLRLAPIKMEILSLDPYIVLFHDVVSPRKMQRIRAETKPYLIPSTTYNPHLNAYRVINSRTSKSVWLEWDMNNDTKELTIMLEDATSLNINSSEMFQVMNYGVGGLFNIHADSLLTDEERFIGPADRIATALFYLSDVPQGGGTVFPYLNLTVFPQAGSVLFWYNLDTRGNEDLSTIHGGCPVIVGSKWVMSKWIYDMGQEFRKPCYDLGTPQNKDFGTF